MTTTTLLHSLLTAGARDLNVPLTPEQSDKLLNLIAELADWNTRVNLTAIRDSTEMLRKHLLDSLSIHAYLHGDTVADIGSGAGFPGLPLAIVNPQRRFTLVDSVGKKTRFMIHAATTLGLTNVTVANERAEAWKPGRKFDSVVSRALASLPDFIRFAGHLCARDGRLLAMKGQYPQDEIDALPKGWRVANVRPLQVPGLEAQRHLIEISSNI